MKNCNLIACLVTHVGEVLGPIKGRDGYLYVKLVKVDLIEILSKDPDADMGFELSVKDRIGYFDSSF